MYQRPIYRTVKLRLQEPRRFIHVLLGPRQVGKTTMALAIADELGIPFHYVSADNTMLEGIGWLHSQWEIARQQAITHQQALLIIDEVQKIPHWSEAIKKLWDEDTQKKTPLKILMLGSSPWLIQKGMSESLAGRFEVLPVTHWSYAEMSQCFNWSLNKYIYFGGYPGAAEIANDNDPTRWKNYISDSLIETSISRDILLMTQVNKPILLKRLFQLGCLYSGHVLSYQKLLGQLQEAGNTTTLAHYLDLLSGAGLLTGISKFAGQHVRQRASSPRFMVFNTALISAQSAFSYEEAIQDREYWGHLVESSVGAYLLNSINKSSIQVFYWNEGHQEVDFVLQYGKKLVAIEVKSSKKKTKLSGLETFHQLYQPHKLLIVGGNGIPIQDFFTRPVMDWFD